LNHIFDPFFTTKPPGSGTGLGLPVVQNIIALHNATISIENHPEGGARVLITFKHQNKRKNEKEENTRS
jgi:two-component system sensor histidine kinase HupT/HoxJ